MLLRRPSMEATAVLAGQDATRYHYETTRTPGETKANMHVKTHTFFTIFLRSETSFGTHFALQTAPRRCVGALGAPLESILDPQTVQEAALAMV